jgi:hypothetical protein
MSLRVDPLQSPNQFPDPVIGAWLISIALYYLYWMESHKDCRFPAFLNFFFGTGQNRQSS